MASKTVNELTLKLNADMAELKKDLTKARQQLTGFQKGVSDIGSSLKAAFSITAIVAVGRELAQFGQEVLKLGSQFAGTKKAFDELNQPNLLNELRKATGETVTDIELMKAALDADDLKANLDDLPMYFAYARKEVQETGGSVTELVGKIINGLGKESKKSLTELGISTKEFDAELKKTGDYAEALNNIISKRMKEAGPYIETAADVTARWGARWENMKAGVGVLVDKIIVKIAPILEDIRNWFVEVWKTSTKFILDTYNGYVDLYNESMIFRAAVESIGIMFNAVWGVVKTFFSLIVDNLKGTGKILAYVINPANWGEGFSKGLAQIMADTGGEMVKDTKKLFQDIGDSINQGIQNAKNGKASYLTIDDLVGSGGGKNTIKQLGDFGKKAGKELKASIADAMGSGNKESSGLLSNRNESEGMSLIPPVLIKKTKTDLQILNEVVKAEMNNIKSSVIGMSIDVSGVFADIFVTIGEGLGNAFTSTGNVLKNVFLGIMDIILDFASNLGKELIALGLAAVSLKALFANPFAAIAAGTALIAISKAVRNMINKGTPKFAYGGIVPGNSFSGDRVPILANSGEMVLNRNQQANLFRQLNNGGFNNGNMVLTARIAGSDLLFAVEQEKRKQSHLY